MFKATKGILTTLAIAALLMMSAAATFAQTTGSVTMTATVSNFVELTSGGAVTLTGNSGGSIITDGTANSPLAVVVNLGELGPSNTNSFVQLSVPLRLRSNVASTEYGQQRCRCGCDKLQPERHRRRLWFDSSRTPRESRGRRRHECYPR